MAPWDPSSKWALPGFLRKEGHLGTLVAPWLSSFDNLSIPSLAGKITSEGNGDTGWQWGPHARGCARAAPVKSQENPVREMSPYGLTGMEKLAH